MRSRPRGGSRVVPPSCCCSADNGGLGVEVTSAQSELRTRRPKVRSCRVYQNEASQKDGELWSGYYLQSLR